MVHNCTVYGCTSSAKYNKDLRFHRFPRDARRRKWLTLIDREDLLQKEDLKRSSHLVCSVHFEDSSIKIIKHLKENALPSMLLHNQPHFRCQLWIDACRRPDLNDKNIDKLNNMYICSLHFERWMYIKKKLKSAAIPVLNLPSASICPMSTQTEAEEEEQIIRDLHSRGVQHQIDGDVTAGVSVAASTSAQTSRDSIVGLQNLPDLPDVTIDHTALPSALSVSVVDLPDLPNEPVDCTVLPSASSAFSPEGSSLSKKEIKVFCPKCDTEVSHTAEGIQEDQTKILIAKVYHYLEQEYEELKTIYGDLDLTPLSKFRQRTALATGVSETTVLQILKEEQGRNTDKRQEPPKKRRRTRKRSRQTDSSSEDDSSDDNDDDNEQSSNEHEAQTVVVKVEEPPEYYSEEPEIIVQEAVSVKLEPSDNEANKEQAQIDPISLDVKTEPRRDVVDKQHTQGESSMMAAASSVRFVEQLDENTLFGDTEIKTEEIEIHEEGVS